MIFSTKYSYLVLRIGLAAVFFWFGIDKFFHPVYWLNAWVPAGLVGFLIKFGVSGVQFVYLQGVFEVLIGLSLVTKVFIKFFSLVGVIFLIVVIAVIGFDEIAVRDIGLIGALLSVFLWPERNS